MDDMRGLPSLAAPDISLSLVPSALRPASKGKEAGGTSIREAAQQFEAYFLGYLMGVMRETVPDGPFGSKAAKAFHSFYDAEIGRVAAQSGGLGLARMLEGSLVSASTEQQAAEGLKSPAASTDTTTGKLSGMSGAPPTDSGPAVRGGARDGDF